MIWISERSQTLIRNTISVSKTKIATVLALLVSFISTNSLHAQFRSNSIPSHEPWSTEQYIEAADQQVLDLVPGDEIWWISSRDVEGQLESLDQLCCLRFQVGPDHDQQGTTSSWELVSAKRLARSHNEGPDLTTVFYVHGNRTDPYWSMKRGSQVYDHIFNQCEQRNPVRFVIWHWPAEQFPLPVQEYEDNSIRAIIHGRHFAKFCMCLDPERPVGFVGYSLGSQFLLSAAEQISHFAEKNGGNSRAWQAADIRVVTLAPVAACSWPANELQATRIGLMIDNVLVLENSRDIALRAFKFKCKLENQSCLCGSHVYDPFKKHGMAATHVEVGHLVGREHSIANYVKPPRIRELINDHLLLR